MADGFGDRPGLASGGNKDLLWAGQSVETAWDSAVFIKEQIGENVEIMEVSTKAHRSFIQDFKIVREKIVQWLKYQVQENRYQCLLYRERWNLFSIGILPLLLNF